MESPKKVLVICSDADLSDLYKEILETSGFTHIERMETVTRALELLKSSLYDIVVFDCRDPTIELPSLENVIDGAKVLCVATEKEEFRRTLGSKIRSITKPFNVTHFINTIVTL
jgi:DNA-binding response OmpR family regulator